MNGKDSTIENRIQQNIASLFDILLEDCNKLHEDFIFQDIRTHYNQMIYFWDHNYQEVLSQICPTCAVYFEIFRLLDECHHLVNPENRWRSQQHQN